MVRGKSGEKMIKRQERAQICDDEKRELILALGPCSGSGRQLIGCVTLIVCELLRDQVDQSDIRWYINVLFNIPLISDFLYLNHDPHQSQNPTPYQHIKHFLTNHLSKTNDKVCDFT